MPKLVWKPSTLLYPVPVLMVSCQGKGGKPNIITVAWAGTVCSDPPMLSIAVQPRRFSYQLLKETGEFVANLPTERLAFAVDFCGVRSGREVDKFAHLKLTPEKASVVGVPMIKECPVNIECRVRQTLPLGSHELFLAEVVAINVDEGLVQETGRLDLGKARLLAYVHGHYYGMGKPLGHFGFSVRKQGKK